MSGTRTIYIHGGGDQIEVEVGPSSGNAELTIRIDDQETDVSLTDGERRELIRALGGRL